MLEMAKPDGEARHDEDAPPAPIRVPESPPPLEELLEERPEELPEELPEEPLEKSLGEPLEESAAPAQRITDFDAFYLANFDRFIVQLHAYTADMATAQDVVQEAFARALQRWSRVSTYDNPEAWVRRVAWNLATSNWRRIARFNTFMRKQTVEKHVAEPSPDRVALVTALATLPESQRRAVVLHYLGDLSVADIALQERVATGTVKSWLHRGRAALAAALAEYRNVETGTEVHDG